MHLVCVQKTQSTVLSVKLFSPRQVLYYTLPATVKFYELGLGEFAFLGSIYILVGLCPNYARQGQIFPNSSKRNQNLAKKVE